jgi:hypothetical protein
LHIKIFGFQRKRLKRVKDVSLQICPFPSVKINSLSRGTHTGFNQGLRGIARQRIGQRFFKDHFNNRRGGARAPGIVLTAFSPPPAFGKPPLQEPTSLFGRFLAENNAESLCLDVR